VCGAGTPFRGNSENADDMFNFRSQKEASAFLKFVENGATAEKALQRVSCKRGAGTQAYRLTRVYRGFYERQFR